jgi:hypothetical protein
MTTETAPSPSSATHSRSDRDSAGRFAGGVAFHSTLDAIQAIAEHAAAAAGIEPAAVGRDRFNSSRHDLALMRECPSAQGLVKKFKRPLSLLIQAAIGDRDVAGQMIGQYVVTGPPTNDALANDDVIWSLKAATFAIGRAPTAQEYDHWIREWARERRERGAFGVPTPASTTLLSRFGDWSAALEAAGAVESAAANRQLARRRSTAAPCETILDNCIDEIGCLPSRRYFEEWAKRKGIPVGSDLKPWGAVVDKCRDLRKAAGKWTPSASTSRREGPPLPAQVPEEDNMRRRSGGSTGAYWTRERIIEALRDEYGAKHLNGRRPSDSHYRTLARGRRDLPSAETVRHAFGVIQAAFRAAGL